MPLNERRRRREIIAPNIFVHTGIFEYPSLHVPVHTDVNVCVSILENQKTLFKTMSNTHEGREEMVYLNLKS